MKVAVLKETFPGERRVALVPTAVTSLVKSGLEVVVESAAGVAAGCPDDAYRAAGATIVSRDDPLSVPEPCLEAADRGATANSPRRSRNGARPSSMRSIRWRGGCQGT